MVTPEEFKKLFDSELKSLGFKKVKSMYYLKGKDGILGGIKAFRSSFSPLYYINICFFFDKYEKASEYPGYYDYYSCGRERIGSFDLEEIEEKDKIIDGIKELVDEYVKPVCKNGREYYIDNYSYNRKHKKYHGINNWCSAFAHEPYPKINKETKNYVNEILELMAPNYTGEEKAHGYALAQQIEDIEYLIFPPYGAEEKTAEIIASKSDEAIIRVICGLLQCWLRGEPEPGWKIIFNRLVIVKDPRIDNELKYYYDIAKKTDDREFARNIKKLLKARKA